MAHVVIIGAGVGGVPCAYELRKKLGKQHRVTLIGSSPFFEFTPSNPWIAVGWRTREQTRVDLRAAARVERRSVDPGAGGRNRPGRGARSR